MSEDARVHYLEIVTPDVQKLCTAYAQALSISFSDVVAELGGARTATLADGGTLGVRAPMHEAEEPTTRPYYLVSNIEDAVISAENSGAEIVVPPMEIPGRGQCAIVMFGPIQIGFWQV